MAVPEYKALQYLSSLTSILNIKNRIFQCNCSKISLLFSTLTITVMMPFLKIVEDSAFKLHNTNGSLGMNHRVKIKGNRMSSYNHIVIIGLAN